MKNESYSLIFFVTRPLFLGIIYSLIFKSCGSDSLIAMMIGTFIGAFIIFIINKCDNQSKYYQFLEFFLLLFFIILEFMIIETFINTLFLVSTPRLLVIIPTFILCLYASFKSMRTIKKTAFHLLILSITIILVAALSLTSYVSIDNTLPLFTHNFKSIFTSSFIFGILSASPNIVLKEQNIPLKTHLIVYFLTSLLAILIGFIILSTLTPKIAQLYRFPEYTVLKRIKIFNFIENVENILSATLYLDHFIFITLLFKKMQTRLKKKLSFFALIVPLVLFTTLFIVKNYYPVLLLYHYSYIIVGTFIILMSFSALKKLFISSERHK